MKSWNKSLVLAAALMGLSGFAAMAQDQAGPTKDVDQTVAKPRKSSSEPEDAPIPSKLSKKAQPDVPGNLPSFKSDVNVVNVDIAVLDNKGHFIPNLPRGNFRVLEDNVPQQIKTFGKGNAPMTVCLLIEFSGKFQRPASVVKEMLENSLDAGATRIKISVEAGGKKLIQITDNGCGMVRDDAMLAFERHATSKIKNAENLLSVATLGFRGEALPSIASVSRLRLETQAAEDVAGTVIEINGGKIAPRRRSGPAAGNVDHGAGSVLQCSGAQEISEGGVDRAVAHCVAGHALCAGASRKTFRAALGDECHAGRASGGRV